MSDPFDCSTQVRRSQIRHPALKVRPNGRSRSSGSFGQLDLDPTGGQVEEGDRVISAARIVPLRRTIMAAIWGRERPGIPAGLNGKASQPVRSARGPGKRIARAMGEREPSKAEQDGARTIKPFVAADRI